MEHGQEEVAGDQEQWVLVQVHRQLLRRVPLLLASQLKLITDQPTGESVIALLQVRSYRGLQISFMCFANLASLISLVSFGKATSTRTRTPQNNKCNCYEFECSEEGSLQTKLNAGLSEQQQEDLFQNERSFHEVKL